MLQENGTWAWDSHYKELVLVVPAVLAMLGDNPMQSELSCHIGLTGKYFCRICYVKGSDALDRDVGEEDGSDDNPADNASDLSVSTASNTSAGANQPTRKKRWRQWVLWLSESGDS